jgi:hypothetical protein
MGKNERARPDIPEPDREPELERAAERHRELEETHRGRTPWWRRLFRRS